MRKKEEKAETMKGDGTFCLKKALITYDIAGPVG